MWRFGFPDFDSWDCWFPVTENLTSLIEAAKENGVEFVYALSPGLDITFSSAKDVQFLKRKLEQVWRRNYVHLVTPVR